MTEAVNKDGASQRTRYVERATVLIKYAIMRNLVATTLIDIHRADGGRHIYQTTRRYEVQQILPCARQCPVEQSWFQGEGRPPRRSSREDP